jgi:prolipoprotein diacylglyceryltransferase
MNGSRESGRTAADTAEGRNVEGGMSFRGGLCLGIGAAVWGGRTTTKEGWVEGRYLITWTVFVLLADSAPGKGI